MNNDNPTSPASPGEWRTVTEIALDRANAKAEEAYWQARANECGTSIDYGPAHDPYGTACDLPRGHAGRHSGPDPLGAQLGARLSWLGGGYAAGDPLPVRDIRQEP